MNIEPFFISLILGLGVGVFVYFHNRKQEKEALEEMEEAARKLGGNAVLAVDIDYEVLGQNGSMLMVSASGTAVSV